MINKISLEQGPTHLLIYYLWLRSQYSSILEPLQKPAGLKHEGISKGHRKMKFKDAHFSTKNLKSMLSFFSEYTFSMNILKNSPPIHYLVLYRKYLVYEIKLNY